MADYTYKIDTFVGGISEGSKSGYKGGYQFGESIDIRSDRDSLKTHYRLQKESSTTVVDLVKWFVEYNGAVFGLGDAGNFYKRDSNGTWAKKTSAISGCSGQGMAVFNTLNTDALWYAGSTKLGRAISLSSAVNSITYDDDYFRTNAINVDQSYYVAVTQAYTLTGAVNEGATHKQTFIPTKSTVGEIEIYVTTKGTGDWTLVIHDANNVAIESITKTNATLSNTAFASFIFSTAILIPGNTYHFHIYSSNTTGTAGTTTSADLETAIFREFYRILEPDSYFHPMKELGNLLLIGNGNYLATLEDTELYNPERLAFPRGEKVRAIEVIGGYAQISTWRGDDIGKYGSSKKYIWDGTALYYNDYIPYSGTINAMQNGGDNMLYDLYNTDLSIAIYTGAVTKKRTVKGLSVGKSVEVYPGATTVWNNILYFGISGGTSTDSIRGVWAYGKADNDAPTGLTLDYIISTGSKGSTVQIGSLLGINQTTFLVAWKDGSSYGVDNIDTATEQVSGYFNTLRFDGGHPNKEKQAKHVTLRFAPLTATDTLEVFYRINNKDFTTGTLDNGYRKVLSLSGATSSNVGATFTSVALTDTFFDIEFKVKLIRDSGATAGPKLYSLSMDYTLNEESKLGTK